MTNYKHQYQSMLRIVAVYQDVLMPLLRGNVTPSCEDENTHYLDLPDGLRLVFRESKYTGWYLPGEAEHEQAT